MKKLVTSYEIGSWSVFSISVVWVIVDPNWIRFATASLVAILIAAREAWRDYANFNNSLEEVESLRREVRDLKDRVSTLSLGRLR